VCDAPVWLVCLAPFIAACIDMDSRLDVRSSIFFSNFASAWDCAIIMPWMSSMAELSTAGAAAGATSGSGRASMAAPISVDAHAAVK
jgi:hypothetical protein